MIGLDTNVLVRYLVQDDPVQSSLATRCIEGEIERGEVLHLALITLCELVWVLSRAYRYEKSRIREVLAGLLQSPDIHLRDHATVWLAFEDWCEGEADFADCLVARLNAAQGCATTLTFDRAAARNGRMTLLQPQDAG